MVSIEDIKRNFSDFAKQLSRKKGKKLSIKDKEVIFTECRIFEELFEEKGFLLQAEKVMKLYSSINKKGLANDADLRILKEILIEIK